VKDEIPGLAALAAVGTALIGLLRYLRGQGSRDRRDAVRAHEQVIEHYQEIVEKLEGQVTALLARVAAQDDRISELETQVDLLERELKRERNERISGSTDVTLREVK
jgi:predicted RNase H-like nuclease (RuvC/YqgF family)